jgi:ElaB/YqjD/DUF883 family membrane-anchored ribosome-binding protein
VTSLASSTGEQVQHLSRRAQTQYEQTLEENPLAIGAIALALGAVVGMAIPSTRYENQLLGDTRENLVQSVEDAARGAFERVQEVAGEVTKQVQDQAQASGSASAGGSAKVGGVTLSGSAKIDTGGTSGSAGGSGSSGTGGGIGGSSSSRKTT